MEMDFGRSKQKDLVEEGSGVPYFNFDLKRLWENHPSLPLGFPGFSRSKEEDCWIPETPGPAKGRPEMDTAELWKNHPSLPKGFMDLRMGKDKEESPHHGGGASFVWTDSENITPLNKEEGEDCGKGIFLSCFDDKECGGSCKTLDGLCSDSNSMNGSSNKDVEAWDRSLAELSFSELLGLATSHDTPPLLDFPNVASIGSLFPDSQESSVLISHSNGWSNNSNTVNFDDNGGPAFGVASNGVAASSVVASSAESNPSQAIDEKESQKKVGLNKKPRQKKPKRKIHRPKILLDDYGKPKRAKKSNLGKMKTPRTPKPLTPKQVNLKKRKKSAKNKLFDDTVEEQKSSKSCKKDLSFELENCLKDERFDMPYVNNVTHQYQLRRSNYSLPKWEFDLNLEAQNNDLFDQVDNWIDNKNLNVYASTPMPSYKRVFRRDQCLRRSNKLGPNFPKECKKRRSNRRREISQWVRTILVVSQAIASLISYLPIIFKKRRKGTFIRRPRQNLATLISMPMYTQFHQQQINVGEVNKVDEKDIEMGEPGCSGRRCMSPSPGQALTDKKKKSKRQTKKGRHEVLVDFIVQKLNYLSIKDENGKDASIKRKKGKGKKGKASIKEGQLVSINGAIVPHKGTKQGPQIDFDAETLKVWNIMMEGSKEKMDKDEEKRWDDQKELFRDRIEEFISCMHLIQGDRRFNLWKGSVLDSAVGAYLTQNVSDKLSSSAFMQLASEFPNLSINDGNAAYVVEEEDDQTPLEIKVGFASNSATMIAKSPLGCSESSPSVSELLQAEEITPLREESENQSSSSNKLDIRKATNHWEQANPSEISFNQANPSEISSTERKKSKQGKNNPIDWDNLRRTYSPGVPRTNVDRKDSIDWEAVRHADVHKVAKVISERGMNNVLAARIKEFLDRVVKDHGRLDLEWIRDIPPEDAKQYLLSFRGLGLKSVECIRLLALRHHAFPVDTNVARITVRLGWVPLQRLPENVFMHTLELYPLMDSIQKYLWPRLNTIHTTILYELHYQMITFGKVFCTKIRPNCEPCPLKGICKHYASAAAAAENLRNRLPAPEEKRIGSYTTPNPHIARNPDMAYNPSMDYLVTPSDNRISVSVVEVGLPYASEGTSKNCEPIIEMPESPGPESIEQQESDIEDIEDLCKNKESDEFLTIRLQGFGVGTGLQEYPHMEQEYQYMSNPFTQEPSATNALVTLTSEAASTPARKLKNIKRLRTEHQVYELPDSHPFLIEHGLRRVCGDPSPFLLAIWTPGEKADSIEPPQRKCNSEGCGQLCEDTTCLFCNTARERDSQIVRATLLIPCRTAMRAYFPLNGTYFQVNEVFADHETSYEPILVPRAYIWRLPRRIVYFGTSTSSIFRGLITQEIRDCFWKGYICLRGFDRKTRAPKPLAQRLHIPPSHIGKGKATATATGEDDE